MKINSSTIDLKTCRAGWPLPRAEDFYAEPTGDAHYAWKNIGGRLLEEVYAKFIWNAEIDQEDYMWMFPVAFAYYFPVIDKYLREVHTWDLDDGENETDEFLESIVRDSDGCHAWILGCCVQTQFHYKDGSKPPSLVVNEISMLSAFVKENVARYSIHLEEQSRILAKWSEVDHEVNQFKIENLIASASEEI